MSHCGSGDALSCNSGPGTLRAIDAEALARLTLHRVVVIPWIEQPGCEPSVDDGPALGFGLVGEVLLHHRPRRSLWAGARGIAVALAGWLAVVIDKPLLDIVEDGVEGVVRGVLPRVRWRPWLDDLDGVAVGILFGSVVDVLADDVKPLCHARARRDVDLGTVEPDILPSFLDRDVENFCFVLRQRSERVDQASSVAD